MIFASGIFNTIRIPIAIIAVARTIRRNALLQALLRSIIRHDHTCEASRAVAHLVASAHTGLFARLQRHASCAIFTAIRRTAASATHRDIAAHLVVEATAIVTIGVRATIAIIVAFAIIRTRFFTDDVGMTGFEAVRPTNFFVPASPNVANRIDCANRLADRVT